MGRRDCRGESCCHDTRRWVSRILAAFHTLGAWDFEFRTEVPDFRSATRLAEELSEQFSPNIAKVEVIPAFPLQPLQHYPFRRWPTAGRLFMEELREAPLLQVSNSS